MKFRSNKRCPRCNIKMPLSMQTCPSCQLNFSKFESATNKGAKQAYAANEPDQVIMRKGFPADVKKWKLLLFTIFLGFLGAHHYYVGRKHAGLVFTIFFFVAIANVFITTFANSFITTEAYQIFYMFVLGWGVVIIFWLADIFNVMIGRYKIPVSVER